MAGALISRPHVFERDDKLYLTTPLTLCAPTDQQIEEFAFASAVRSKAPNEHIGWLEGRYVEAGNANLNNAMWLSSELALKSLTPMLMPVTVMHDPRTAVGTIADCKLINSEAANSRIDTILAIWRHRFTATWEEAEANIKNGELMQSMECFTPWYTCSECAQQYIKLPGGQERASWCDHLRTGDSRRILGDVCFTGTGLIFGSRGGVGAYTEAQLDHFREEVAEYHDRAHRDSTYRPTPPPQRSTSSMTVVQIEDTELALLRQERNDARSQVETLQGSNRELTTKLEQTEAAKLAAETAKATAETKVADLTKAQETASLKDSRMTALGTGFMAKLGETSKTVLSQLAGSASDADWEIALAEREELAGVKRDAKVESAPAGGGGGGGDNTPAGSSFGNEEVASFLRSGVSAPASQPTPDGAQSIRTLAKGFASKGKPKTEAAA